MYDTNIYTEPDGSKWWRVFRHNNPSANGLFSSTDDFIHGVKKSDDVWFEVGLAKEYDIKEYLVKQKLTSSDTEVKYRLTQTVNAMDATYNDTVQGANVVYNTSAGYSTPNYRGGLRYIGTETYLCWNNGSREQWWGAIGSWGEFSNGIPSINQGTITTGYLELYIPPWSRKWQPAPVFLPGKSHGARSLAGYSLWGHKESDTTKGLSKRTHRHFAQGMVLMRTP